ncbi:N-acylphosphatidylethanolamine synthase [Platanthera zijinensis]|uniref:N-acylphosphatidylethanolamine synthase n=1 Tax=Platanthera zijinensis TaxID=2320716 RepID=A0AAP0BNN9_9ASPA
MIDRIKARLVARGFTQQQSLDYEETFTPLTNLNTVRVLSAVVRRQWPLHQLDIKNAFLNDDLQETVYTRRPPVFEITGESQHSTTRTVLLLVYVDAILITGDDSKGIQVVKQYLSSVFQTKDIGNLRYFLGLEIARCSDDLVLSQRKYCLDLLQDAGYSGCKSNTIDAFHQRVLYLLRRSSCYLTHLLSGMGVKLSSPATLFCDSQAAIHIAKIPVFHELTLAGELVLFKLLWSLALGLAANALIFWMHGLPCSDVCGFEGLTQILQFRPSFTPLTVVSNHVASVDDPLVIASLLPPSVMLDASNIRWTLCATDRCFKNAALSAFFRCVKVLPVSRGDGIYQKGMDMALSKLNNGGWVHIFPEGSRSRDGGKTIGTAKRGVGRLILDADTVPTVIPFVHSGMQEIMPLGSKFPKVGKKVTVVVGDPIPLEDLIMDDAEDVSRGVLYDAVSSRISHVLRDLKFEADKLALEHAGRAHKPDRGYEFWQQVDWEAFGMEGIMRPDENRIPSKPPFFDRSKRDHNQLQETSSGSRTVRAGFSYGGGIVSRVRGYMNPTEFMGFAAGGLFKNGRFVGDEDRGNDLIFFPAKWWRSFDGLPQFCR